MQRKQQFNRKRVRGRFVDKLFHASTINCYNSDGLDNCGLLCKPVPRVFNHVEWHSNRSSNVVMKYILYITVKQDRQCMYNIILWHVHKTSVAKET